MFGREIMNEHRPRTIRKQAHDDAPEDVLVRYDPVTIFFHWSTALLVVVLWILGQTSDLWPRGPAQSTSWSLHVLLGITLAGLLATRIVWRIGPGRALPSPDDGFLRILARITHVALYGLLILVVVLGVANTFVRGFVLFGGIPLPQVGGRGMRGIINQWHGLAANTVMIVAGLHAAAALFHHYIRKDQLLQRMWRVAG